MCWGAPGPGLPHVIEGHFDVAARFSSVHGLDNRANLALNTRPAGRQQNYDANASGRKILLKLQVPIRGYQDLVPGCLRGGEELAIA